MALSIWAIRSLEEKNGHDWTPIRTSQLLQSRRCSSCFAPNRGRSKVDADSQVGLLAGIEGSKLAPSSGVSIANLNSCARKTVAIEPSVVRAQGQLGGIAGLRSSAALGRPKQETSRVLVRLPSQVRGSYEIVTSLRADLLPCTPDRRIRSPPQQERRCACNI